MNYLFYPTRVYFEKAALEYPLGQKLWEHFQNNDKIEVRFTDSHNRVTGIPGSTPQEAFREAKKTLVIGVRRNKIFETCKPSAHYQLPLSTSCPGKCQYCYLHTTLGKKPYLRIYVNIEEILEVAKKYIEKREPQITVFEGAATSDPLAVEHYSGNLARTISFFSDQKSAYFRFVTKFTNVDSLLEVEHRGRTRFRFSINTLFIVRSYEQGTPPLNERLEAAGKVARAGYPLGFIIGPIIAHRKWEEEYEELFLTLKKEVVPFLKNDMTLELITHRFTPRAKSNILEIFPGTDLPLNEKKRRAKYGQFGYIKYLYPQPEMENIKEVLNELKEDYLPEAKVEYFV